MTNVIDFDLLDPGEAHTDYPVLWNTFRQSFPNCTDDEIDLMVTIATGVCPYCWERKRRCQCWNDE